MNSKTIILLAISSFMLLSCATGGGSSVSLNNGSNNTSTNNNSEDKNNTDNNSSTPTSQANIQGVVTTLAGGPQGVIQNTTLKFKNPVDLSLDGKGNLYVLDTNNLYKIDTSSGNTEIVKQSGQKFAYTLPHPQLDFDALYIDKSSNISILLSSDSTKLLKLNLSTDGKEVSSEDKISFDKLDAASISGISKDSKGNIFISDKVNSKIYKITDGKVSLFAGGGNEGIAKGLVDGTGKDGLFKNQSKIAVDKDDNLYVADSGNNAIRKISQDGKVTTFAGDGILGNTDSGNGVKVRFNNPQGITVDNSGNIFVADTGNHRIRKISSSGIVTTVAGSVLGYNDATGNGAAFYEPNSIVSDGGNILYVSDLKNLRIRKIELK